MRFLLIDRILEVKKHNFISGIVTPSFEEVNLKRPESNVNNSPNSSYPQILILESLMQLAGKLVQYSTDFKYSAMVLSIRKVEFADILIKAGDRLQMSLEMSSSNNEGAYFKNGIVTLCKYHDVRNNGEKIDEKIIVLKSESAVCTFFPTEKLFLSIEHVRTDFNNLLGNYDIEYK
ncbi:MAG: hypothetical protein HQK51_02510 [Oligoflexia bacterium]|nr:hypothetical protein [Oligoflexia bacterium]